MSSDIEHFTEADFTELLPIKVRKLSKESRKCTFMDSIKVFSNTYLYGFMPKFRKVNDI